MAKTYQVIETKPVTKSLVGRRIIRSGMVYGAAWELARELIRKCDEISTFYGVELER